MQCSLLSFHGTLKIIAASGKVSNQGKFDWEISAKH